MMGKSNSQKTGKSDPATTEIMVGKRVNDLRVRRGLPLRALAASSGLNINTLCLVENGKTSPSVSTLQQLATALDVPVSSFFESEPVVKSVIFTAADQRPQDIIGSTRLQNLGKSLAGNIIQPFVVTLKPGMGSGERMIVHTGHEFIFCFSGSICYTVGDKEYFLKTGDSLVFESRLPHCWENKGEDDAEILLVLYSSNEGKGILQPDFLFEHFKKEMNMKIAVITDDGKTISQHFGRAPYYLVLTIEEGKVINQEMREKMGHNQFAAGERGEAHNGPDHGRDAASHNKHVSMAETISDCRALLCGGMGMGAYESMRQLNITPVVTELTSIEDAIQAFIDGKLIDRTELLH